jgi:excisionase family DNA binding protein
MPGGDGHTAPLAPPEAPTPEEAVVYLVGEVYQLRRTVEVLAEQVSRLTTKVQRPDLQKYTVAEACDRLKLGHTKIYDLMNAGELEYVVEAGRRIITEEAVQSWERKNRR